MAKKVSRRSSRLSRLKSVTKKIIRKIRAIRGKKKSILII